MRYPKALIKGDTIGVTAPSSGVTGVFNKRIDNAIKRLENLGFKVVETESLRKNNKFVSADPETRAIEFMELYRNKNINAIIPPWGGEFLMDMLPYLDIEELRNLESKWIMGFSDTSTLNFVLTTNCDMATVHGPNLSDFGAEPVDPSVMEAINILMSTKGFSQVNLESYQKSWGNVQKDPFVPYQLTERVEWKSLWKADEEIKFSGRLIGGCLDVICKLIGTPYDKVTDYITKYKDDKIVWYFESCEMNAGDIYRTVWQIKMNGWFDNCSGVLIGRPAGEVDMGDFDFKDALKSSLESLSIPVIYDVDIGHLPPQITIINGAFGTVEYENGAGKIHQVLR
ncbi:LD-carboxypeptidase [Sporosalibacterium faouarense]|uniref:LD-carboxypeptidase n=1 Tax=Sporosalibacterium faouarense TaxID=516123 RepID=UPI00192C3EAB